ncbi:2-amino-4-hydroxy-6-hydroxymethyldihydropteridine diphosphokinase [Megalodesulfovibrio paquesii]
MPSVAAYLGLGSNLAGPAGEPLAQLAAARARLLALPMVQGGAFSRVYWTEPFGVPDPASQPWYANQVARLDIPSAIEPQPLLEVLLQLEVDLGRDRRPGLPPLSPRALDVDLLLVGDAVCDDPACLVPHPRLRQRAFVLVPLAEIAPDLVFPDGGSLRQALDGLAYTLEGDRIRQ